MVEYNITPWAREQVSYIIAYPMPVTPISSIFLRDLVIYVMFDAFTVVPEVENQAFEI